MTKRLISLAGASASVCAAAFGQGPKTPHLLGNAIYVQPVMIAKVRYDSGQISIVGEWMEYRAGTGGVQRYFDCFGDADSDGFMDDTGGCGLGSSRWYFGTGYCNGFATNDMVVDTYSNRSMGRADFAWYWTCGGFGTEECIVAIWTQDSSPSPDCALDSFDSTGWALHFGTLSCNPGAYYYTNADISSVGSWPVPAGGSGSYIMAFLTSGGSALATCAQPMLWGDLVDDSHAANGRGTQETEQLDDDNPLDGAHTTSECYTYSFSVCPNPLGAMLQFWGDWHCCCYNTDCDGNGVVDTRDFTCFLNLWVSKDPAADFDGNGVIDTRDVIHFLDNWVNCR